MAAATDERKGSRAKELEEQAGPATGAMPPPEPESSPAPDVDEVEVEGADQLSMLFAGVGGKMPTNARLSLRGSAGISAGKGYKKGTVIRFSGEAVVDEVGSKDKRDPTTRQVTDCKAKFSALLTDLVVERVVPPGD